jgi:hypothetical protein
MGTRSVVNFQDKEMNNATVLSVYQQYDGYETGVGKQIADFLRAMKICNGIGYGAKIFEYANGIGDLALQYIVKYKTSVGNLYAVAVGDIEEYNYYVNEEDVKIIDCDGVVLFSGDWVEYIDYIDKLVEREKR